MKNNLDKRKNKIIGILLILLVFVAVSYIFAPNIESFKYRIKKPGLDAWAKSCSDSKSSLLPYNSPYWGGNKEGVHETSENDEVFAFNDVIELEDGVYITAGRGLTNWCTLLHIYSRKDLKFRDSKQVDGNTFFWPFYLSAKNVNANDFPHVISTEMSMKRKSLGYVADVYLAAPGEIDEDGTITLIYHSGADYKEQKEIKIPVSSKKLN